MAEVTEVEVNGEVRTIKDTTARNGVAANATAIADNAAAITQAQSDIETNTTEITNIKNNEKNISVNFNTTTYASNAGLVVYKNNNTVFINGSLHIPNALTSINTSYTLLTNLPKPKTSILIFAETTIPEQRADFFTIDTNGNLSIQVRYSQFQGYLRFSSSYPI